MLMNVYEDINDELRNQTIQVGNYFKSIIWRLIFGYLVLIRDPILNLWIGPKHRSVTAVRASQNAQNYHRNKNWNKIKRTVQT